MRHTAKIFLSATILAFLFSVSVGFGQEDKSKRPSPPATVTSKVGDITLTIDYSRPAVKGRKVWGELVPFDKVWRTGANEATTFEASADVKIEGNVLPAGKYALFTIPGESEWTIIFNKEAGQWGSYNYKAENDALRVKVTSKKAPAMTEMLTFTISNKGVVAMMWENLEVDFTVTSAK